MKICKTFCQTHDLGLALGVDFTFAEDNNDKNNCKNNDNYDNDNNDNDNNDNDNNDKNNPHLNF